jgi:hypothetical protein
MQRTVERRDEYHEANHHSITNQWNTTVVVNKRAGRNPATEEVAVARARSLRIGFFYWFFKKLVQPNGRTAPSPPSKNKILWPLEDLNTANAVPWLGIIKEVRESKVKTSLSIVVRLLWHCPLPEESSVAGSSFDFDATVNVITEYSSEYIIRLLRHRLDVTGKINDKEKHAILNTHVTRVMKLVGRSVAETIADKDGRREIACPMNTVCNNYTIDNPTLRAEYKSLAMSHKVDTRNSVVPPMACIINKAMLCVKVVETHMTRSLSTDATGSSNSRSLQNMKNNLIWYLEQVGAAVTMYHMYNVPCTMYHVPCTICTMYHMYHMYHVPYVPCTIYDLILP